MPSSILRTTKKQAHNTNTLTWLLVALAATLECFPTTSKRSPRYRGHSRSQNLSTGAGHCPFDRHHRPTRQGYPGIWRVETILDISRTFSTLNLKHNVQGECYRRASHNQKVCVSASSELQFSAIVILTDLRLMTTGPTSTAPLAASGPLSKLLFGTSKHASFHNGELS